MSGSLGSGQVQYHPDRPVIHFGSPAGGVENALLAHRLRNRGLEITERTPQ